jgi:Zn-dependent M16 (insulinase) family peptidase
LASLLTENIYRHKNGLKHINVINSEDFSALFVVNTPVFNNSGVAHAVEHMVFRGSKAFPKAETLFQITSLTDAKINASTLANTTYFHCQSHCPHTFLLVINYLLNGLFSPKFSNEDLRCEIHDGNESGVIYRELLGAEQSNINSDEASEENEENDFYYGGMSASIGQLSRSDLLKFHQHYYQASNITLVTANADVEKISGLMSLLPQQDTQSKQPEIRSNVNRRSTNDYKGNEKHQKKYSSSIKALINTYQLWLHDPYYQQIDDYHEIENSTDIEYIEESISINTNSYQDQVASNLIFPLISLSNLLTKESNTKKTTDKNRKVAVKKVMLPGLFTDLYQQAKKQIINNKVNNHLNSVAVYDQGNSLWLAKINLTDQALANITAYLISAYPIFLARRCQGHCYATQALIIEDSTQLVIYSAFDVNPSKRVQDIAQCLLTLSQDDNFISESLTLAKIKYCQSYLIDNNQGIKITPNDISTYLKALSNDSHPKV